MDDETTTRGGAVQAVRDKLMDGRTLVPDFAEAIDRTPRTVQNYITRGMPVEYHGRTPVVIIDAAIEWLRTRKRRLAEPRSRGRPPKAAPVSGRPHRQPANTAKEVPVESA